MLSSGHTNKYCDYYSVMSITKGMRHLVGQPHINKHQPPPNQAYNVPICGYNLLPQSVYARFIPTHVGNANIKPSAAQVFTVHPHACGERLSILYRVVDLIGSSPRMWGTLFIYLSVCFYLRFIPTHVGNAYVKARCPLMVPVHPHACGERLYLPGMRYPHFGSSPRMWGTHIASSFNVFETRFIPTHVGNANNLYRHGSTVSVHPHACGERPSAILIECTPNGSSPRMWGTHSATSVRFIPTHVGNAFSYLGAVHPHACGERFKNIIVSFPAPGSSPRMWGTPVDVLFPQF